MFRILSCLALEQDLRLTVIAGVICLIGSYTAFALLDHIRSAQSWDRRRWLGAAAVVTGTTIWTTHFVAMLAYRGDFPISYDVPLTILSVAVAIGAALVSYHVVFSPAVRNGAFLGGGVIGAGTAAMHFTGMAALRAPARLSFDPGLVAACILGSLLAAVALSLYRPGKSRRHSLLAALVLTLSICAMHFTAMGAVVLVPDPTSSDVGSALSPLWLGAAVSAAMLVLLIGAIAAIVIDRRLTDLRGLADASFEGILITRGGRVLEANRRIGELLDAPLRDLKGEPVGTLLPGLEKSSADVPVETDFVQASGTAVPVEVLSCELEYRGEACTVLSVRDLRERKAAQARIEHLAYHDALTGLPNRAMFHDRLEQALARSRNEPLAVLVFDLDRFKAVNDTFGHAQGDAVLQKVAGVLRAVAGKADTVARLGGDEFVILQTGAPQPHAANELASRLMAALAAEMDVTRDPTAVGISIGISTYPSDGATAEELLQNADLALYRAKENGRGLWCFFEPAMDDRVREARAMGIELRQAVTGGQIALVYQPLFESISGAITGYEALARWDHPERGAVAPTVFIPIAEESGTIIQLGEWVLNQACRDAARWPDAPDISVNISAVQFQFAGLVQQVESALRMSGLPPHRLILEVTETALLKDRENAKRMFRQLKELGVRIAMDDFGTGYSSLSNLQSFPFDKIKIDRSFTARLATDAAALQIVRAIIALGRGLGLPVAAEGVETAEQLRILKEEMCGELQGFLLGTPQPLTNTRAHPSLEAAE